MKQYEKKGFNVEQALNFVKQRVGTKCSRCECFEYCYKHGHTNCVDGCIQYLMSEVPKPQIKTQQEVYALYLQFINACRNCNVSIECAYCESIGRHPDMAVNCFYNYLCKTQGVPDNLKGENEK